MNFLKPGDEYPAFSSSGLGGGHAVFEPDEDDDEELGPVAKALLEALKGSGADDLLRGGDDDEDKEDEKEGAP
jgi:hypothetical protein